MNRKDLEKITIKPSATLHSALKQMDETFARLLLVMDGTKFISLLSIGDIQRAIIDNYKLTEPIINILRDEVTIASAQDEIEAVKDRMLKKRTEFMPIINEKRELVDVIFWEDIFKGKERLEEKLDLPVVIMAGGEGKRLRPLTNVIPKALVPVDDKTIAEHIIENFISIGCKKFFFTINYKAGMIQEYFENLEKKYDIQYLKESRPLGTAGSLNLFSGKIETSFFVTNCDILINENYYEIYKYHKEFKNELTLVGALRNYPIPYGTLETGDGGNLLSINEKPELSLLINSGMYILEPHLIDEIPNNKVFHITDLIRNINSRNGRVGVFPVSEKSWVDIGEWEKYLARINMGRI